MIELAPGLVLPATAVTNSYALLAAKLRNLGLVIGYELDPDFASALRG